MSRTITIGRNPQSSIVIGEEYDIVSNDHADIVQEGNELMFVDHSSNGTIINGQKIQGKSVSIYPGDRILLAGICELNWGQINPFIVPMGRPTVARNIRGEIYASASDSENPRPRPGNSRITELYDPTRREDYANSHATLYGPPPIDRRTSTNNYQENRSLSSQTEQELGKWNWGAFFFGWIWGVFNKVYITLVQLVVGILGTVFALVGLGIVSPIFSIASLGLCIWFGVKGSRMAWDNGAYRNLEHFRSSRHNWNVAALVVFCISILFVIISLLLFIDIISKMF